MRNDSPIDAIWMQLSNWPRGLRDSVAESRHRNSVGRFQIADTEFGSAQLHVAMIAFPATREQAKP